MPIAINANGLEHEVSVGNAVERSIEVGKSVNMKPIKALHLNVKTLAKLVADFADCLRHIDRLVFVALAMAVPSPVLSDQQSRSPEVKTARLPVRAVSRVADYGAVTPSPDARRVADWIADNDDSNGKSFVLIDKQSATLYVFDGRARLFATSPVLLGSALGDENVPGIGERPISLVRPEERTTPAGRFVAERGRNARGEDVVWIDYDAAVSMHRVVTSNVAEKRLERLASTTAKDNRISYGCINVPVKFYESIIRPAFAQHSGIVYILPDVASFDQVFGM